MSDLPRAGVQLVAENGPQFGQQLDQANTAMQQFGQTSESTSSKVSSFGQVAGKALSAVQDFAVRALSAAGQAVVDWVEGAKDAATKYDRTMSDIVGLTGTSADQVKELSKQVLSLAGQVGKGPQELAEALYFVASSGFQGADAMTVLTASAKAAAAGLGDTKTIADLTTSILNAYQLKAGDAAHVTDILTQAVKDGKAEPDQLAGALGRVIPIAAAAGVNLEEVAASIASMTRVGLDANEATTALRGIISSLEKPSVQTQKALKSIGLSADDVRASIKDRGLLATMKDLYDRTGGNLDILGRLIPNVRALTGVLGTTATQGNAYAETLKHMYEASGATDRAFKQATTSMDFQGKALKSTLQALQIELGEALLPGAAAGTHALVVFAQSLQGQVGPAVTQAISIIGKIASFLQSALLPALAGVTAALIAYGLANAGTLIPALVEQIGVIAANTTAWLANAAAVFAAAGPFIAIGAAIAAVGVAWTQFNTQVSDATTQLLESRPWWNDSTAAIESYGAAVGDAKAALSPYAATIRELRSEIQGEIESLAKRDAAGMVSDQERAKEMAHINQLREGLTQTTTAYNAEEQALLKTAAASQTGTARLQEMAKGQQDNTEQTKLDEKELEKLEKQIQKTFDDGAKAVGSYVDTAVSFMAKWHQNADDHAQKVADLHKQLEQAKTDNERTQIQARIDAENKAYATQQQNDAAAYAKQEAAQRAHLGQMLEDYTLEQVKLGNITGETADKILSQIEQQFGQVQDVSARTFLAMTSDIDKASKDGGASLDSLGKHLGDTADDAVTTKEKMDALAKKYTIEVLNNFDPTKQSLDELRHKLEEIPSKVYTEIVTTHTDVYNRKEQRQGGAVDVGAGDEGPAARASGGPVYFGQPYTVGESGPELFVPQSNGYIVPTGPTQQIMQQYAMPGMTSPPGFRGLSRGGDTVTIDNSKTLNMPVYSNQTVAAIQQSAAIAWSLVA